MTVRLRVLGESAIEVNTHEVTPASPQLFPLLLYLGMSGGRAIRRTELAHLLHPEPQVVVASPHSLRQLLYRLRGMAVPLTVDGQCIRLAAEEVTSDITAFEALTPKKRLQRHAAGLSILPSYEPVASPQLLDWLEAFRSEGAARVRRVLREDLRSYRRTCEWDAALQSGRLFQELDASDEETVLVVSEALFMLGRRQDAIEEIDTYVSEFAPVPSARIRHFRSRLLRAAGQTIEAGSAFYGRTDVMHALTRQWLACTEGQSQVALILGRPGIGKSRTASEFSAYVSLQSGHALVHRCDSSDSTRPYSVFRALLPQLRAMRGSLGASPTYQTQIARLLRHEDLSRPIEPAQIEATRGQLQLALIDIIEAIAAEHPLLLSIDDAQFLDPASQEVLNALSDRSRRVCLMLQYAFRGTDTIRQLRGKGRVQVYRLGSLARSESLALLHELLPDRRDDADFLSRCITRSGGTPYFLHVIGQSASNDAGNQSARFDIQSFAATSYFALSSNARQLFEACLLLRRFATLARIREIACLEGPPLLAGLRELEEQGLLHFANGELRCAHSLLEETSRSLIPGLVAAALHERIARCLDREAGASGYGAEVSSAAARHWLAAGDLLAATRVFERCAAYAAGLGEPRIATSTLLQVPYQNLPLEERTAFLNTVIEYAEVAGNRGLFCSLLRDLLSASRELNCNSEVLEELEFRITEAELERGAQPGLFIGQLMQFVRNEKARTTTRIRASIRLLIAADMNLDARLAWTTLELLNPLLDCLSIDEPLRVRAELIHETVFGDQERARGLAAQLVARHPRPLLDRATVSARRNAAFALSRLGLRAIANPILLADFHYMSAHRVTSEAAYNVLLLADHTLADGDVESAAGWLSHATALVADNPHIHSLQASYYSCAACVALARGHFEEAEDLIQHGRKRHPTVGLPRYQAIALAIRIKAQIGMGMTSPAQQDVELLQHLYDLGAPLGAQDPVAESVWICQRLNGKADAASATLTRYLECTRRELGPPEASLRATTLSETCWNNPKSSRQTVLS